MENIIKKEILFIAVYKYLSSIFWLSIGLILLYSHGNIIEISRRFHIEKMTSLLVSFDAKYYMTHFKEINSLLMIFAMIIIFFSVSSLMCTVGLSMKRKWGAVGLAILSVGWLIVDIIFIIKIFSFRSIFIIILNILIILLLIKLAKSLR